MSQVVHRRRASTGLYEGKMDCLTDAVPLRRRQSTPALETGSLQRRHTIDTGLNPRIISCKGLKNAHSGAGTPTLPATPASISNPNQTRLLDSKEVLACKYAAKYRLPLHEVKRVLKEIDNSTLNSTGGRLNKSQFDSLMCRIFAVDQIDEHVSRTAYAAVARKAPEVVDPDDFFSWYVQNMFTQVVPLNSSPEKAAINARHCFFAKKLGVSQATIDKVEKQFDHFDVNHSGYIDYEEFKQMLVALLHANTLNQVNPQRLKKFWSQIDCDGDGKVDFEEFTHWYLTMFPVDSPQQSGSLAPIYAFYDSFNPTIQRHHTINPLTRHSTME